MAVENLLRESKGALKSGIDEVGEEGRRREEGEMRETGGGRRGKWKGEEKRKIGKRKRRREEGKGKKTGTYCKKGMCISTPLPLCKTGYCLLIKVTCLTCP